MSSLDTATMVLEAPALDIPEIETETKSTCRHYWLIDKPNGPFSHGVCKYCHEERNFSNSPPQYSTQNGMRHTFDVTNRRQLTGGYRDQINQLFQ